MTEDEAKTKWCPMVRISGAGNDGAISNRGCSDEAVHADVAQMCMASDCMAWRWKKVPPEYAGVHDQLEIPDEGHCGLAGKE